MRKRLVQAFQAAWLAGVVTIGLGTGTVAAATHGATATRTPRAPMATTSCGLRCVSLISRRLGSGFTMTVNGPGNDGTGGQAGQSLYLGPASVFEVNADFTRAEIGRVFQFCGIAANNFFAASSYVCLHYPAAAVYELEWSPFGFESGLCAGVAVAGLGGANVTLQSCGEAPNTMWVYDPIHRTPGTISCTAQTPPPVPPGGAGSFCPLINGGDRASVNPLVLTLDPGSTSPGNQLTVRREWLLGTVASSNQQFAGYQGPAH